MNYQSQYTYDDQKMIETAISLITTSFNECKNLTKPALLHSIRVGLYLYNKMYAIDLVIAGLLHDTLEDTTLKDSDIEMLFGKKVTGIVLANTKDMTIEDKYKRRIELIARCVSHSEKAAIVKTADILDNHNMYLQLKSIEGIEYCKNNAIHLLRILPKTYTDPIFKELENTLNSI